jgi:hypothetical protein
MSNWNSKEKSALELINIAGTLWLDKNVELIILRRKSSMQDIQKF